MLPPVIANFLTALATVAGSPYAFVAYVVLVATWGYVIVEGSRLRRITSVIDKIPNKDRASLLQREYPPFPRSGLSAEQWIRSQRARLLTLAVGALAIAMTIISTVYIVENQRTKKITETSSTNWAMNLYMVNAVFRDADGKTLAEKSCDDEARSHPSNEAPIELKGGQVINLELNIELVIDNLFSNHKDFIYPVGLTTTWDKAVFTILKGDEVRKAREATGGGTFSKLITKNIRLSLPMTRETQYIILASGAMMNAEQVFYANEEAKDTAYSIWHLSYHNFEGALCAGYWFAGFSHLDGHIEHVTFPMLAIPINVI